MELNIVALKKALEQVNNLDFSLTKRKLLEKDYAGWSQDRIDKAERNYKNYLALIKTLNGYQPVPNGDIDRFWHEHILDTRRYLNDCADIFGAFLHHYPFFGMNGEQDYSNWQQAISSSEKMWFEAFGETLYKKVEDAQKCPQACPNPGLNVSLIDAQKCPQACPNPGKNSDSGLDYDYPLLKRG